MADQHTEGFTAAARALYWVLGKLGGLDRKTNDRVARLLGRLWYAFDGRHREIAVRNLELAFAGELTAAERRDISRNVFTHLAKVILEIPYLVTLNRENLDEFVTFTGVENVQTALAKNKGMLVLGSHFGNWEMMSLGYSLGHHPFNVVVRPLDNRLLDQVIHRIRCRGGNELIAKSGSVRRTLKLLRKGQIVVFLMDQTVDWYDGVFVPFFGEIACTSKAMAVMALRTGAPVIPVHNFRRPDGRYEIVVGPEIPLVQTGDQTRDVEESTARFNRVLEEIIHKHPEQWLWVHRRWKVRHYLPWPRGGMK